MALVSGHLYSLAQAVLGILALATNFFDSSGHFL